MEDKEYHIQQAARCEKKSIRYADKGKTTQAYLMAHQAAKHRNALREMEIS
jgi:hypothetical protein